MRNSFNSSKSCYRKEKEIFVSNFDGKSGDDDNIKVVSSNNAGKSSKRNEADGNVKSNNGSTENSSGDTTAAPIESNLKKRNSILLDEISSSLISSGIF